MTLSSEALARAGLADAIARRVKGEALGDDAMEIARAADLLVLGAAADLVRRADCGDEVRVHAVVPADVVVVDVAAKRGTEMFRHIALARLAAKHGARLAIDLDVSGLETAQIALSFGISDLVGSIVAKRSLTVPIEQARDELAGRIRRAKREPVFVASPAHEGT